jgi:hypothetical protein
MGRSEHEPADAVWVPQRKFLGDHPSEREAVDVSRVDAGGVHDGDAVSGEVVGGAHEGRRGGTPESARVEGDDAEAAREHGDRPPPGAGIHADAADEQDGRSVAHCLPVQASGFFAP